ncbi:MAG: sensor domain-containing diguanylate cyclase [Alphaproteobacteria bacterium]|nr:MAG: sensor domain-containing diguanylate cyclase [Alphaproteobacteria bacterium]
MSRITGFLRGLTDRNLLNTLFFSLTVVVAVVGAMRFLPEPLVTRLVRDDVTNQAGIWRQRLISQLDAGLGIFVDGTIAPADRERLSQMINFSDVFRFKIFLPDGRILWSTRPAEIGEINTKPYFADIVMKGQSYYKQEAKPLAEIDRLTLRDGTVLDPDAERLVAEIYTPVVQDGRVIGAIEFYTDITDVYAAFFDRVQLTLSILAAIAILVAGGALIMVFSSGRRRERHLRERASQEKELLAGQLRLAREIRLLGELNEWLQSCSSLEELFDMVSAFMTRLLPDSMGSIYVYSNSRDVLDGACAWNGADYHAHIRPDSCWALRRGRTYFYGESEIDFTCDHMREHEEEIYFCIPILAHGETVGLMTLRAMRGVTQEQFARSRKLAQMCAEQISLAIANVRMRDQLRDQSIRDALTGLYNRRHFIEALRRSVEAAKHVGADLSLVAIDVDHFKKFNDNHGHDAGDMVLRAVGSALEAECDGDELACRLGGEEFMLLLPLADTETAARKAENLRRAVEQIVVRYGEKNLPHISISLGVSSFPQNGTFPQALMKSADDALYEAKAKGRNQVVVAGASGPEKDGKAASEAADRSALEKAIAQKGKSRRAEAGKDDAAAGPAAA